MRAKQKLLVDHYTRLYGALREKSDSPDKSRTNLVRKLVKVITINEANETVSRILNVGSGPQLLERQLISTLKQRGLKKAVQIATLDLANLKPSQLLLRRNSTVAHTRADASKLPYQPNSFDMVVSNLAIDFAPFEAIYEAFRVLDVSGLAFFNFHHPNMIPEDINCIGHCSVKTFWSYLKENRVLYPDPCKIEYAMNYVGFRNIKVEETSELDLDTNAVNYWWEVEAEK
jgi:ubiquinone/menaquinone biosynthesis C-methylase UbiE